MCKPSDGGYVNSQYGNDESLALRQRFQKKYSVNPQPFFDWVYAQYQFERNANILEMGCGNAVLWERYVRELPQGCVLTLSDFSKGMLDVVASKFSDRPNVLIRQIDIQSIPFADDSFDVVIANHMLYHVPDIPLAIREVHRVLRPGGTFYCTTNGVNGVFQALREVVRRFDPREAMQIPASTFTLQNGRALLNPQFGDVALRRYEDSFRITNAEDFTRYIQSTAYMSGFSSEAFRFIEEHFRAILDEKGFFEIPKEAGMFIATKAREE